MIEVIDKENCCGCGSCVQICPVKCLELRTDEEGFWYPQGEKKTCVECGLCERVCPILHAEPVCDSIKNAYAGYALDEQVRMKSSSGGIFTVLAEEILRENGVVFGAAFDDDYLVHHVRVDNIEELERLRGSKYLQSRMEETYAEALELLKQGRKVLFTGTECQIAGLKGFLGKTYENLFTVDILCHGVPSPKVWSRYLNEKKREYGGEVQNISFRNKRLGWKKFSMMLKFKNSHVYRKVHIQDSFMRMFLQNLILRPSCYVCKFKGLKRNSDLTIGDCWGIEVWLPEMDDDKGTSVVLVHTDKGERLLRKTAPKLVLKEGNVDMLLSPMAESRRSANMNLERSVFFQLINKGADWRALSKIVAESPYQKLKAIFVRIVRKVGRCVR